MRCEEKACPNSALLGSKFCRAHGKTDDIPAVAPRPITSDVEIVKLDSIPTFRVQNKRSYDLAKAAMALQPDNALKIKVLADKDRGPLAHSVLTYAKKMGVSLKYRTSPGFVYIWKCESKPAAMRKAAS
jgi:hypothetical protein